MGLFGGLDAEAYDREYTDRQLIRRIISYFTIYRRRITGLLIAITFQTIAGVGVPVITGWLVDILETASNPQQILPYLIAAMFTLGISLWVASYIGYWLAISTISDVVANLRIDAFTAAIGHDLSFYDRFQSGKIISRITYDSDEFGKTIRLVSDLIHQLLRVILLLGVLVFIEWRLMLIVMGLIPVVFLATNIFRAIARRVTRQGMRVIGKVNTAIQEAVTGIGVAKNFRQESQIYGEFGEVNRESYRVNLWRGFIMSSIFPVLNSLLGIGMALVMYAGGRAAGLGTISAGAWYLFLMSVWQLWFPMINVSAFWSQFQTGLSATERIFALIDAKPAVVQTGDVQPGKLPGRITFDQVSFRYTNQEQILDGFSLDIRPGENIALVGHTGAGKSSIVKLVARFYEFQGGQIGIDGHDIRSFDLNHYRQQLGIVSQVPFLFSGTVADNIRYACPQASDADILRVANSIGEGEWLETLPDGLNSQVGERGGRLSMGQRQLVALTRVLVQNPSIFILDEATASVDPFTESQIQAALDMILANSTSILIAHRLSTVRSVDRIIVLDQGNIIEEGSHDQLLAQGGHYAELYNTYFRHQSLAYIEQARTLLEEVPAPGD